MLLNDMMMHAHCSCSLCTWMQYWMELQRSTRIKIWQILFVDETKDQEQSSSTSVQKKKMKKDVHTVLRMKTWLCEQRTWSELRFQINHLGFHHSSYYLDYYYRNHNPVNTLTMQLCPYFDKVLIKHLSNSKKN